MKCAKAMTLVAPVFFVAGLLLMNVPASKYSHVSRYHLALGSSMLSDHVVVVPRDKMDHYVPVGTATCDVSIATRGALFPIREAYDQRVTIDMFLSGVLPDPQSLHQAVFVRLCDEPDFRRLATEHSWINLYGVCTITDNGRRIAISRTEWRGLIGYCGIASCIGAAALFVLGTTLRTLQARRFKQNRCMKCGYPCLSGVPACPECGTRPTAMRH